MSQEIKDNQIEKAEKEFRKQGGAFDTLARILRGVEKMIFKIGSVIQDRPGESETINAKSVFEIFQQNRTKSNEFNLIVLGRRGTGDFKNTNYLELTADARTDSPRNSGNGQLRLNISRDGQELISGFSILELQTSPIFSGGFIGPRIIGFSSEADGENSGIEFVHYGADGNAKFAIAIDKDGIQMFGLPTSAPATSGAIWRDGNNFLKIVP